MISLSEVSHMYPACILHVSLMYHLRITGTCLHKMAKIAITDLFGNNGKKQQLQSAFFGRRYYRVIFLSCHLFMPDRGNKTIILKLKNQKKWQNLLVFSAIVLTHLPCLILLLIISIVFCRLNIKFIFYFLKSNECISLPGIFYYSL
jgi:hypothetical protein